MDNIKGKGLSFHIFLLFISVIFPVKLISQTVIMPAGRISYSGYNINSTAKAAAMGSSVVSSVSDSSSLLWNPAGLGMMEVPEIGLHHDNTFSGASRETLIIGTKSGRLGGAAFSVDYINNGEFEKRDEAGTLLDGKNIAEQFGVAAGWGKSFFSGLYLGLSLKGVGKNIAESEYYSLTADAGLIWNINRYLNAGISFMNFGYSCDGISAAGGIRAGVSSDIRINEQVSFLFAVSGETQINGLNRLSAGGEGEFLSVLSVRAGYIYDLEDSMLEGITGITAGLGIKLGNVRADYAYVPFGELGETHKISFVYSIEYDETVYTKREYLPKSDERVILFDAISFDHDSAELSESMKKLLKKTIKVLKANPKTEVRIIGHASQIGSADYNQKLSELRALAIRNYLIREGDIRQEKLFIIGFGENNPIVVEVDPEDINSEAAATNRRGLFEIVKEVEGE